MDTSLFEQLGLNKGEIEIYLILLKKGESSASEIAQYTKIARPNVYDYLNKLKEKGFVSFVTKQGKVKYIPSSPEKVLSYIEEKRIAAERMLPQLLSLYRSPGEKTHVEVYEGAEGYKAIMHGVLAGGKEYVGWGASDKVKETVPDYIIEWYLEQRKKRNIKARLLFVENDDVLQTPLSTFRALPREYASPTTTLVYGIRVAIMIYTSIPLIIIVESKELAEGYKKYFELLWHLAQKR